MFQYSQNHPLCQFMFKWILKNTTESILEAQGSQSDKLKRTWHESFPPVWSPPAQRFVSNMLYHPIRCRHRLLVSTSRFTYIKYLDNGASPSLSVNTLFVIICMFRNLAHFHVVGRLFFNYPFQKTTFRNSVRMSNSSDGSAVILDLGPVISRRQNVATIWREIGA